MNWQPIETAPKDGTTILVWAVYGGGGKVQASFWEKNPYHGDHWADAWCVDGLRTSGDITHWMPLPDPPEG